MVATSFVSNREQQINIVSRNLQVVTPQLTTSSLQIRNIASTANDIADTAKLILTNFIFIFVLSYYYHLYNCVHYKQHEHLEKINEKPEHYVVETSIITSESVESSTITTESVKPSAIK